MATEEITANLDKANKDASSANETLKENEAEITDAIKNAGDGANKSLATLQNSISSLKDTATNFANTLNIQIEEITTEPKNPSILKNIETSNYCPPTNNDTGNIISNYITNKLNNTKRIIETLIDQTMLLNQIMNSKNIINIGFEKDLNLKKTLNSKNKNYIITTQRLSQFYSRNINTQTSINNILKIVLIILSISIGFLLKTEFKDILKGTLSDKSIFIKPLLPTIISIGGFLVYIIYLFINKNIHEISPLIVLSTLLFIIFLQYSTIKLLNKQSPFMPILFGIAVLPYIILFIIEKLNLNHNIIPIHDKNTKLSFKINEDIKNLKLENTDLDEIFSKYKSILKKKEKQLVENT